MSSVYIAPAMTHGPMLKIALYGDQYRFVRDDRRFVALIGGIGSGKSLGGAARALCAALGHVGSTPIPTPNLGIVTAPTFTMLRDATLRTFKDVAADFIDYKRSAFAAPARVQLKNGSEILFRSADNADSLRGPNITWWWGDEAALYAADVWQIMIGRLRQFGRQGYAWLTSTPKGRNWIWKLFKSDQPLSDSALYTITTRANPFLEASFVDMLAENYAGNFAAQELGGEFISNKGLIYPEFDRDRHTISAAKLPAAWASVKAGVDWGMVNPGVIQVVTQSADDRLYLVHEEYQRGRGIGEWVEVAAQLRNIWQIEEFACDPAEPDYIRMFTDKGLKARGAHNTVSTGIQAMKRRLAIRRDNMPGMLLTGSAIHTASEFEQYQWAIRGSETLEHPVKANDHALDALRYAVMAFDKPSGNKPITAESRRVM